MKSRTLEDLRAQLKGHIYLRFNSEEEYGDFLAAAQGEGFRFGEHLPCEYGGSFHDMIALCEGKQLAFCGTFSRMAYQCGGGNVHRIDYAQFARDGSPDVLKRRVEDIDIIQRHKDSRG